MSEIKGPALKSAIKGVAEHFNDLNSNDIILGIKTAVRLDTQIKGAEKALKEAKENPVVEEEKIIPTGPEIEADWKDGEYR